MEKEFSMRFVVVQVFSPLFFLTYRMTDCRTQVSQSGGAHSQSVGPSTAPSCTLQS